LRPWDLLAHRPYPPGNIVEHGGSATGGTPGSARASATPAVSTAGRLRWRAHIVRTGLGGLGGSVIGLVEQASELAGERLVGVKHGPTADLAGSA